MTLRCVNEIQRDIDEAESRLTDIEWELEDLALEQTSLESQLDEFQKELEDALLDEQLAHEGKSVQRADGRAFDSEDPNQLSWI